MTFEVKNKNTMTNHPLGIDIVLKMFLTSENFPSHFSFFQVISLEIETQSHSEVIMKSLFSFHQYKKCP